MTKKDYIRIGVMLHLLVNPEKRSPKEAAKWSADIWDMTEDNIPRKKTNKSESHYEKLRTKNAQWFEFFVQFWKAYGDTRGRDEAASEWLILCNSSKFVASFKHVVYAAGILAESRPSLKLEGTKTLMAYRWIKLRRFSDIEPYKEKSSKAKNALFEENKRELLSSIQQAKNMYKSTQDNHWHEEIKRAENELKKLSRMGVKNVG